MTLTQCCEQFPSNFTVDLRLRYWLRKRGVAMALLQCCEQFHPNLTVLISGSSSGTDSEREGLP